MSLTKIGSIGINTGIQLAGVTTVATLHVGSGVTLSSDGDGFFTGIITATFAGDGTNLTGVASTDDIRTNTNATFLQNINVSGSTTTGSLVSSGAISGTTGTFSGAISGTTGTFSGNSIIGGTSPLTDAQLTLSDDDAPALAFQRSGSGKFESAIGMETNSALRFYIGADSSTVSGLTEAMQIDASGRVGINSTSPAGMLEVQKNGVPAIISNYDNQKHIRMTVGGSGGGFSQTTGNFFAFQHQPYADRGTDNNLTERVRIEEGGTLKVNENLSVAGIATVGSAVTISESGIEASGIGVTIANLNGGQIGMNRNMVKNGAMMISQRGTSALTWGQGNAYQIDTMRGRNNGGEFSMQQVEDAPAGTGLYYSLKCQVTSADTNVIATEYNTVVHIVEGFDFQRTAFGTSGAKTLTLSFYVKSNLTGTFTGAFVNVGNNRSLAYNYTINSANTWERKVINVPGDTSGTWNKGDSVGVKIIFALKVGSNFQTSNAGVWEATESMGTTSGQNVMASTSNNLYLTGIQLEEGTEATPFEHVHYSEALRQCQRYFWRVNDGKYRRVSGYKRNDSNVHWEIQSPVPMRAAPSPTLIDGGIFTNFASTFTASQSNPAITEWDVFTGKGLLVVSSTYSSTHVFIPSWESYALDLSAEF